MSVETFVFCLPLNESEKAELRRRLTGHQLVFADQADIADRLGEASIFVGHAKVPVPWPEVVAGGRLKWIQSTAAGLDHCLTSEVQRSSILVSGCSGVFAPQVAEHALALLLAMVRGLRQFERSRQEKRFERLPTDELRGKQTAILGYGGNGRKIARYLEPMVGRMVATDCFWEVYNDPYCEVFSPERQLELLAESQIVIVTLPLVPETYFGIGSKEFAAMPTGSYFVNVGRGQLVDEVALAASLTSGHLAGAALDVTFTEPLPVDSPLWDVENLWLTPHVGAQSVFRVPETLTLFLENWERFQRGESLVNQVDKDRGFPRPEHRWDLRFDSLSDRA